jgi:hypothetical protein
MFFAGAGMGKKQGKAGGGGTSGKGSSAPGQQRRQSSSTAGGAGSQTPDDTFPEGLDKAFHDHMREGLQKYMASFNNK